MDIPVPIHDFPLVFLGSGLTLGSLGVGAIVLISIILLVALIGAIVIACQ